MKIIESILTNNPCYTAGKKIAVKGLMIHSVGTPQPSARVFVKNWNSASYDRACVHAFIDGNSGDIYQCLPWDHRGWHCASGSNGSGNNTHIGVEMCEPATIKYTGGASWVETGNGENTKAVAMRTYKAAVELFAFLCEKFNLDPLADGVIISHSEGHKRGIASNHGDVEHIWHKVGLTMDQFRADIKSKIGSGAAEEPTQPDSGSDTLYKVQIGAFKVKENAAALESKIKAAGFDTYVTKSGDYYKVQVGAFGVKSNAEAMLAKMKAAGYADAFITTTGTPSPAAPPQIKEGSIVRLKQGAKTYTGGNLAAFVYTRDHVAKEIKGDRVVITYGGVVVAAVKLADLTLVKA